LLKQKRLEAYVRARRLGGDEARVALVCCSDDLDGLEHDMRRLWIMKVASASLGGNT